MEDLMTTTELAEYLRVDRITIYRYLRENKIPALRVGGRWRFKQKDIDEWLTTQAEKSSKLKKILVVDDEEVVRDMLRNLFMRNGYEVSLAANGEEALEYLKSERLQLIILDLNMPGMSGIEVLSEIRLSFKEIPVVILTGHSTEESAIDAIRLGVEGYIQNLWTI